MAQSGSLPLNHLKKSYLQKGFIVYLLNKLFSKAGRKNQGQVYQILATVISLVIVLLTSVILYYSLQGLV